MCIFATRRLIPKCYNQVMDKWPINNTEEVPVAGKWVMEVSENTIGVEHPEGYDFEKLPVESILMKNLEGFEPDEKMEDVQSAVKVADMAEAILTGDYNEPPVAVRRHGGGYQVIDGHHRFHAHRVAGSTNISVRVVPEEDIVFRDLR
jgi:hypothetical protein